jgi:hypothetical protein
LRQYRCGYGSSHSGEEQYDPDIADSGDAADKSIPADLKDLVFHGV